MRNHNLNIDSMLHTTNPTPDHGKAIMDAIQGNITEKDLLTQEVELRNEQGTFNPPNKIRVANPIFMELTHKQLEYLCYYYGYNWTMEKIATVCGINKSTVSRTIRRGINKLGKYFEIFRLESLGIIGGFIVK